MAMYDDQQVYVDGVVRFLSDVDQGRFCPVDWNQPGDAPV